MKSDQRQIYDLEPLIEVVEKKGKRVKWDYELETVKFFKMTDNPSCPSLGIRQVEEIQKHVANIPTRNMYNEMKKLDMKLDRQTFEESKIQVKKSISAYD